MPDENSRGRGSRNERPANTEKPEPKEKKQKESTAPVDATLFLIVVILTVIGLVMIASSSYLTAATSPKYNFDTFYLFKQSSGHAVIGLFIMCGLIFIKFYAYRTFAKLIYVVAVGLMVLVVAVGISSNGATRWLELPIPGMNQFQPSEVAKPALIFMLAYMIKKNPDRVNTWPGFLFCIGVVGVMAGLAYYGSLSAAIIIAVIGMGMLFIASKKRIRFVILGLLGGGGLTAYLAYMSLGDHWRGGRFSAWRNPWNDPSDTAYQIIQSLYAVASGGFFGLGIGQSRQKTYLPEQFNDYIFAIISEELGLIGAGIVLLLFGALIYRGIRIAFYSKDEFAALAAAGIVISIASQVLMNVAVVTNTIPPTGITLPFISYGGTSLLVSTAMMGILLNISRYIEIPSVKYENEESENYRARKYPDKKRTHY